MTEGMKILSDKTTGNPFRKSRYLVKHFSPEFIQGVQQHIEEGWSFGSYSGKIKVDPALWQKWSKEIPELREIKESYLTRLSGKKRFNIG